MADISKEIKDFKEAIYGEEVRDSMVSLAQKVNREVETNTSGVAGAIRDTNAAAADARSAAGEARVATDITKTATTNANTAASNAEETRQDILNRLAAGEFKGDKGEAGAEGKQGQSGVMASASGMFSLWLDSATGNLYAEYPDGSAPPSFEFDAETGELFYLTGDDANG